jgi:hypothetical protein
MKQLVTWGHQTVFNYEGSVSTGTAIEFGPGAAIISQSGHHISITATQYGALIAAFSGRTVLTGTSREPTVGSLGDWLMTNVSPTAVASYVAPILVHEGYAERVDGNDALIRFR